MRFYENRDKVNSYPNDNIKNYTLAGIQNNILKKAKDIASLRSAIKAYKTGGVTNANKAITDTDVDELLRLY